MSNNKIFTFAQHSNQILTDEEYEADAQRLSGNQPGIARAPLVNKALKQSNVMAAALAQFSADHTAQNINDSMPVDDIVKLITEAIRQIAVTELKPSFMPVGIIELLPFRETELPQGWYHANGGKHSIASAVGVALKKLPVGYRLDWDISENAGMINLPNMYYEDGRAYFPRAGSQPGVVQGDAIRNITGRYGTRGLESLNTWVEGAFYNGGYSSSGAGGSGVGATSIGFNASRVVPTAEENRPLNISFVPAIYLAV